MTHTIYNIHPNYKKEGICKYPNGSGIANPKLYEKVKKKADDVYDKPSAYKSMYIQKEYQKAGGGYTEDGKEKPLKRWIKEAWSDVGNDEYPVYRPTIRVSKKTPLIKDEIDPSNLKEQIKLKQKIKGKKNLPPFKAISGGAISASNLKMFIDASYEPHEKKKENINGYILDRDLTQPTATVYYNPSNNHCVVIHRGTEGTVKDWSNNLMYAFGSYNMTERFKIGREVEEKAINKYGAGNVSTVGHSQGAVLARKLGKNTKEIINVNPAYINEKPYYHEYDVRSSGDVVSAAKKPFTPLYNILYPTLKGNVLTIPSAKPYSVLNEHKPSILDRLPPNQMIGR